MQRGNRQKVPVWRSHIQIIRNDIDDLMASDEGKASLDKEFVSKLNDAIRELEAREIKVLFYLLTVIAFSVLTLITSDSTLSIFGISLKDTAGAKEISLSLISMFGVFYYILNNSKRIQTEIALSVHKNLNSERTLRYSTLQITSEYGLIKFLGEIKHEKSGFVGLATTLIDLMLYISFACVTLIPVAGYSLLFGYLLYQVAKEPTLGVASTVIVIHASACAVFIFLLQFRHRFKLPFYATSTLSKMSTAKSEPNPETTPPQSSSPDPSAAPAA